MLREHSPGRYHKILSEPYLSPFSSHLFVPRLMLQALPGENHQRSSRSQSFLQLLALLFALHAIQIIGSTLLSPNQGWSLSEPYQTVWRIVMDLSTLLRTWLEVEDCCIGRADCRRPMTLQQSQHPPHWAWSIWNPRLSLKGLMRKQC